MERGKGDSSLVMNILGNNELAGRELQNIQQ